MTTIAADYRKAIQIAAPLAAALFMLAASRAPSQAATSHILMVPASDGYGFDDCLGANKSCGQVIADAWCEAHGLSMAQSFGRAEDITAAIPNTSGTKPLKFDPGSFVVSCKE